VLHKTIVVGPLQCNCVVLGCEKTKEAILIDPGDEAQKILREVGNEELRIKYILHTHAHFDHIGATERIKKATKAPACLHKSDTRLYENLPMQGRFFGFEFETPTPIEKFLEDEEILTFGEYKLQVLHTPGHSPGSICFKLLGGSEVLFSGDTLFKQSIGRTDLWGGDYDQIMKSLRERILTLDGDTHVYPGHGPDTRLGDEKKTNPFLL